MHLQRRALCALLVLSLICAGWLGCRSSAAGGVPLAIDTGPRGSLRILLTNDDGYTSPGIRMLRDALVEAGHDVRIVAPHENRSGSGSSMTTHGPIGLKEQRPGVWSVEGTPADSVRIGLEIVLQGKAPDLVISGPNFGENIGPAVHVSGTIGAALTALASGIPAIAVSVGIDPAEARAEPRFMSTISAFPSASLFVVRLVRALDHSRTADGRLLPERTLLNVNYPPRQPADLAGVAFAAVGHAPTFAFRYRRTESERVEVGFGESALSENVENADTTRFAEGYVTVSAIDGEVLAPHATRLGIEERLRELAP